MQIRKSLLTTVTLLYIYIPIIFFICGWTNLGICSVTMLAIIYNFWHMHSRGKISDEKISIDIVVFIFTILFFAWVGFYAGWGRFVDQTSDWNKHNAVLYDLVNLKWPVYYVNGSEHSMLVYYIAQYIVPAVFGKIVGTVRAAEVMFYIWNEIGLLLVYIHVLALVNSKNFIMQYVISFMIPMFSIPLWISEYILKIVTDIDRIEEGMWFFEKDGILIQYSNNFTLLHWVVPQVIVCWLIIELFLENRECIDLYMFLFLPGILFGTLSFLGIIPIIGSYVLARLIKDNNKMYIVKGILSLDNIVLFISLGIVIVLYFYGNIMGKKPETIGFSMQPYNGKNIIYFIFVIVNILIYAIILFNDNKNNCIFYSVIIELMVLPLFKLGKWNDLVMRVSIPGLFLLMIFILRYLNEKILSANKKVFNKLLNMILIMFLIVGMYYPFQELSASCKSYDPSRLGHGNEWSTMEKFANRQISESDDVKYNYYAYDIENNLFYKYIARKR